MYTCIHADMYDCVGVCFVWNFQDTFLSFPQLSSLGVLAVTACLHLCGTVPDRFLEPIRGTVMPPVYIQGTNRYALHHVT